MIRPRLMTVCMLIVVLAVAACSSSDTTTANAPPTPDMPENWTIVQDDVFSDADITPIAKSLGGEISALRNTLYEVGGKQVKINTVVAASTEEADKIYAALLKMKPEEYMMRHGSTIYEFVCSDAAVPEMREAKEILAQN